MSINAASPRLSLFERQLLTFLEARARLRQGFCLASKTIADHFHVTVRYVQKALQHLRELGEISREWDYGLRTRRRFYLGSRQPLVVNEQEGVESTNSGAPTEVFPPDPPIKRALEREIQESGGKRETPPPKSELLPRREDSEIVAPEVEALAERVAKATRPDPTLAARLASVARQWGLAWLTPAVGRLERKARLESVVNPVGLIVNTLRGFQTDGAPPPTDEEIYAQNQAALDAELDGARKLWGITT